ISFVGLIYSFLKHRTKNLENSKNALSQKVIERTRELNRTNLELSKISLVASETSNAVLIFNSDLILEYANAGFTKMTGYQIDEFVKLRGNSIYKITYFEKIENLITEALRDRKSMQYESMITRKDGSKIWSATTLTPIFNSSGNLKNIVLIDTDIDSIKQIEQQLMQSFEERGLLLKEIHHRVKNNLQIIISLFNLQSNFIDDAVALKALREGQNRIKSMALVHERFYQSEGLSKIDFDVYIHRLAETLFGSYNISSEKIKLNIEAEKISLDIDTAIPCGLILNELINNSIKHAFNENQQGEIIVQFYSLNEQTCRLVIGDNGKGMDADFDFENAETLGMQLITALTQQIDGKLNIEHTNGLKFIIDFKKQFAELI
ncbi:MAG TPA: histidine kinase dimerization/phosphoacceptor domain -containing protein, partial [Bacteroidia bacterium]|nr:histidine kinase dimerization/phosphoacceptor domain -containing protein [Bacteroidia bacterium]